MKHLINREDYIKEYLRISNYVENETKNENELYEGLLSTLFGGLKMLLKKDWANIKCKNPSVLKHLQSIDKSLGGYTMTKMQFSGECQTIRQNIADYFNDILDYKLSQIEKEEDANKFMEKEKKEKDENKDGKGVEKELNIKDKTLLDSINKYKENIKSACKASPKLREYADQMLNSVEVFVNDVVLAELEKKGADKAKIEEEKKKLEEDKKKLDDEIKKRDEEEKKASEEEMKKLKEERDEALNKLGVKPIGDAVTGDKTIETISKQFTDVLDDFKNAKLNESNLPGNYGDILGKDIYLGLQKSLDEIDWKAIDKSEDADLLNRLLIRVIVNKINTAFTVILDSKDRFKEIPGVSTQAMMVSIVNAIIYGYIGSKFDIVNSDDDARLSLMTKCAIDSDATIGFNLPLIDINKPENGNFYTNIMKEFSSKNVSSREVVDVVKNMTVEEVKKLYDLWNSKNDESKEEKEDNKLDIKSEEFAIEFANVYGSDMMKDFRNNMETLFNLIVKKAEEIKEKVKKEKEAEAAKKQKESELQESQENQ